MGRRASGRVFTRTGAAVDDNTPLSWSSGSCQVARNPPQQHTRQLHRATPMSKGSNRSHVCRSPPDLE
jgi:hypothetical protein